MMDAAAIQRSRAVAGRALGLEPDASVEQARAAFLNRVNASGLIPSPAERAAAAEMGLIMRGPVVEAALAPAIEAELSGEIERFAETYWDLSPNDRTTKWTELRNEVDRHPRLAARLQSLSGGLNFTAPTQFDNDDERQLTEAVVELYPLKPIDRARRRMQLVPMFAWAGAARSLLRKHPELEKIEHGLLDSLAIGRPVVVPLREIPRPRPRRESEASSSGGNNWRWGWAVIPVCLMICSGLTKLGRHTTDSPSSSYSPSRYSKITDIEAPSSLKSRDDRNRTSQSDKSATSEARITVAQARFLSELSRRAELTDADAMNRAIIFKALRSSGPSFKDLDVSATGPANASLNAKQLAIQAQLGQASLTVAEIRDLLIEFVKAGNAQPTGQTRP